MLYDAYDNRKLARAYIPIQRYGQLFSPQEALMKGTLFPELWSQYLT